MGIQQHTPGPWGIKSARNGDHAIMAGGAILAEAFMGIRHAGEGALAECQANARLISAAPDLLEALQAIMNARWSDGGISEANADLARAAIAKATGEA